MQRSSQRLSLVLAVVFALAACRFTWLLLQPGQNRVQAQNAPTSLPALLHTQKIAALPLTTNCDSQRQIIQRLGDFPVLQLVGKDVVASHEAAVCQSRLTLQHHGVISMTGVSPEDFSKLTGIPVPSARIAFHQIVSKLQIHPQSKGAKKLSMLHRPSTPGAWISNPSAQQIAGPTTTLQSPSVLAVHVDTTGITHLYEDYRPATTTTTPRLNLWVERQRRGLQILPVQKKPSVRSALENFFSLPTVYAQGVPPTPSSIPGWTLLEEVTLSWQDGYQNAFEVALWVLRQNENAVGDTYAIITEYQTNLNIAGQPEVMATQCPSGNYSGRIPSEGFCGSTLTMRGINYSASAATGVQPIGNVGSIVSPSVTNPQPATQNFGCSYNVSFGTSQNNSFNLGVNSSDVINAGATFGQGTSQGTTQGCASDQVDTSITAQTSSTVTWQEIFGNAFWTCWTNFFNNNWQSGDPRGVVGACPTGPPPQSTGNYSSVQGATVFFPQDTVGFGGIIGGSALVDAGGSCSGSWWEENIDWPAGYGSCTDYQMQSSFQLIFTASAPEITVQACTQAFNPQGAPLNSQQCVPTYSTDPSTWWQGASSALSLQTCAYQANYNPVVTLNTYSTIPPPWLVGTASGGQNYSSWGSSNTSSSSSSTFSSQTNLAYSGAVPSWTFTVGPGLQISQTPSAPDPNTGISTGIANLTPPSSGYTPPNVSMVVNASPAGSAWTFDSATAPQGLSINVSVQPWPSVTSVSPSSGVPGTLVTAQGTGFLDGASMCFGTQCVAASSVNQSGTQITAPAPTEFSSVPVTVENPAGCLSQNSVSSGPFLPVIRPCIGMICTLCQRFPALCIHRVPQYPIDSMWSLSLRNGWTFRPLAYPAPKSTPPIPPGPGPLSWVILADVNPVVARQQHLSMSRGVWVQTVIAAHGTNALALPLHTGDIIEAIDEYPVASVDAVHAILQRPDHPGLSQFRIARNHRESTIRLGVAP